MSTIAGATGSTAFMLLTPETACIIAFIGISISKVIPIPIRPAHRPIIQVSALNTADTFFLEAPIALKIPISFRRSKTLI